MRHTFFKISIVDYSKKGLLTSLTDIVTDTAVMVGIEAAVVSQTVFDTTHRIHDDHLCNRVRYFRGRVTNLNQSETREHCFLAPDWSKFEILPRKYRTLLWQ